MTDISEGGCFVETRALPLVGETVTVQPKVLAQAQNLTLKGVVIYNVASLGFAVQFSSDPEVLMQLREVLGEVVDYN